MPYDTSKWPKQPLDSYGNPIGGKEKKEWSESDNKRIYDILSNGLSALASNIFPAIFPQGVIERGGAELRLGDIRGSRPSGKGSVCIELKGARAGYYTEWDGGESKGPLGLLKDAYPGENCITVAKELLNQYGGASYVAQAESPTDRTINGHGYVNGTGNAAARERDYTKTLAMAQRIIDRSEAVNGTVGEIYLRNRNIQFYPFNVGFNNDVTNYDDNRGYPALVSLFQTIEGEYTGGIHRTYLKDDGSWHAGKKMLGPAGDPGFIKLWPETEIAPGFRILGVGTGIETTLAGITMYGVGGWASGSDAHLAKLAGWLRAHPTPGERVALPCDHLLIWADAKKSGEEAGNMILAACREVGLPASLLLPQSGDDFSADLAGGLLPLDRTPWQAKLVYAGEVVATEAVIHAPQEIMIRLEDVRALIDAYDFNATPTTQTGVIINMIAQGRFDSVSKDDLINRLRIKLRTTKKIISDGVKNQERELGIVTNRTVTANNAADWAAMLQVWDNGETKPNMLNAFVAFENDNSWNNVLWYNQFASAIMLRKRPPYIKENGDDVWEERKWNKEDDVGALYWCQSMALNVSKHQVLEAALHSAFSRSYHPVMEFFSSLSWDGTPRLNKWLIDYCHCKNEVIIEVIGSRWLIGCVARVFEPGCKFDYALILEGLQGIGKSAVFRVLGGKWYTDDIADLGTKDSAMQMHGMWIIEIPELSSMLRSEVNRVKAFMSRQVDHFRPPYGAHTEDFARQSAFAGTVNGDDYLKDETGGRRFWPADCGDTAIDIYGLSIVRDQLIAEAIHRYKSGESYWIHEEEFVYSIKNEQSSRYMEDIWTSPIQEYILTKPNSLGFSTTEILYHGLFMTEKDKWGVPQQMRISRILKSLGYTMKIRHTDRSKPRSWIFCKPDIDIPTGWSKS